jgi:hypothetical protein
MKSLSYEKSFESHPKSKFWSEKNQVQPRSVSIGSAKKYWFNCIVCKHYFDISPNNITSGSWCPYCASRKLCDKEDCCFCFEKSFASHPKSKWWSENNILKPRYVFKNARIKILFNCELCHHTFDIVLYSISGKDKSWCSFCSSKKLCDKEDCCFCFEKSFASHPKSKYWSVENDKSPREIFKSSCKKYKFNCDNCPHTFLIDISKISCQGRWCPYCVNQKLCDNEKCVFCFENSFASHKKNKIWSMTNKTTPRKIFKSDKSKYDFICEECNNIFVTTTAKITRHDSGLCPKCLNHTEKKLLDYLYDQKIDVIYQYKPKWCKSPETNRFLPFDIYIPLVNIIIEIDGPQHFRQMLNWESHQCVQSKDLYKMKMAYDQKISVIRIPFEYIRYENKFKIYEKELKENLYERKTPEIIYICDDDRYSHFYDFNFNGDEIPKIIKRER